MGPIGVVGRMHEDDRDLLSLPLILACGLFELLDRQMSVLGVSQNGGTLRPRNIPGQRSDDPEGFLLLH